MKIRIGVNIYKFHHIISSHLPCRSHQLPTDIDSHHINISILYAPNYLVVSGMTTMTIQFSIALLTTSSFSTRKHRKCSPLPSPPSSLLLFLDIPIVHAIPHEVWSLLSSSFDNDNAITTPPNKRREEKKKKRKKILFCYFFLPFRSRSSISSSFLIFHFRWVWMMWSFALPFIFLHSLPHLFFFSIFLIFCVIKLNFIATSS